MSLLTYKEKIYNIIVRDGKSYRKRIAEELGIAPFNVNRDTKKLISENRIDQDKDGKEVYYIPIIMQQEMSESPIEALTNNAPTPKKKHKIAADVLYETICSLDHDPSSQELIALTGLSGKNLNHRMKKNLQQGKVEWYKAGREVFYRKSGLQYSPIQAVAYLTQLEADIERNPPLKAFVAYCPVKKYARRTVQEYKRVINAFYHFKDRFNEKSFRIYPAEQFTTRDINEYLQHLIEQKQSTSAQNHAVVALKTYFKFLTENDFIAKNPALPLGYNKIPEKLQSHLSEEVFLNFIKVIVKRKKHIDRDLALLLLMFDTGLRVSEVETVCREDIYFESNSMRLWAAKGKRMNSARVPFTLPIAQITCDYLKKVILNTEDEVQISFLVQDEEGEHMHTGTAIFLNDQLHHMEKRNMKLAKVSAFIRQLRDDSKSSKKITVHSFRHFMSVILGNNDMRLDFIDNRMHHKTEHQMTVNYMNSDPAYRKKYDEQYQHAHPLNNPTFVEKIMAIVKGTA